MIIPFTVGFLPAAKSGDLGERGIRNDIAPDRYQ